MKRREFARIGNAHSFAPAKKPNLAPAACSALFGAAIALAMPAAAVEQESPIGFRPSFFKLDNKGDANFNQLLGINDHEIIVGYFGDGSVVPNNGYVLVPNTHYSPENFAGTPPKGLKITQTQAIGINNNEVPVIVGFWQDQNGVQYGFSDVKGVFTTILDPKGPKGKNQNLLGVNNNNLAAGFWTDAAGNTHGFVVDLTTSPLKFTAVAPALFKGAFASQASGINDNNIVCGFFVTGTTANPVDHGFFGPLGGPYKTFDVTINGVTAASTQAFGCSNSYIVGSFVDKGGATHGFTFNGASFVQYDAPGSSQTPAFGVSGTFINGVNKNDDFVGFYSDGKAVHGFALFQKPVGPQ